MGYNKAAGDQVPASEFNSFLASAGLYAASSAGSDTYAITVTPAPNDLDVGDTFFFKADVANTGAATLNVNGLGAKALVKNGATALQTGDIGAGQIVHVVYDGTNFQIISIPLAAPLKSWQIQPQAVPSTLTTQTVGTNTTMHVGRFNLPSGITVNSISIEITAVSMAGTLDISIYSEDGQTQHIAITTASISGAAEITTAVASVYLPPGNYIIAVNPNGTASVTLRVFAVSNIVMNDPASNYVASGTVTITAGTPPTTITLSSITFGAGDMACALLLN